MSVEYWLIDAESGNAQGCYLSLDDALRAAEIEVEAQGAPIQSLKLLGMRSHRREPQGRRSPLLHASPRSCTGPRERSR